MCQNCIARWREEQESGMEAANEHLDALGVPEDSIYRGMASVTIACTINPFLHELVAEMWPTPQQAVN